MTAAKILARKILPFSVLSEALEMIEWIGHGPPSRNRKWRETASRPTLLPDPFPLGWPRWCFGSGLAALTPPPGLAALVVWAWAGCAGGLGLDAASEVVAAVLSPWQRVCHPLFACVLTAQLPVSVSGQGVCYLDTSSPQTCPSI